MHPHLSCILLEAHPMNVRTHLGGLGTAAQSRLRAGAGDNGELNRRSSSAAGSSICQHATSAVSGNLLHFTNFSTITALTQSIVAKTYDVIVEQAQLCHVGIPLHDHAHGYGSCSIKLK